MSERPTIRCPHCSLNQFATESNNCRRCRKSLVVATPVAPAVVGEPQPIKEIIAVGEQSNISRAVLFHRTRLGLSQSKLAERLDVPRTWISKIETGKCLPFVSSLERLAVALEVTLQELTGMGDLAVLEDPFIQELIPYVRQLSAGDRETIMTNAILMAWRSA